MRPSGHFGPHRRALCYIELHYSALHACGRNSVSARGIGGRWLTMSSSAAHWLGSKYSRLGLFVSCGFKTIGVEHVCNGRKAAGHTNRFANQWRSGTVRLMRFSLSARYPA